jgi:phosphoribosylformimino-5-aminoimidazole carboxamide ribotide isomerase
MILYPAVDIKDGKCVRLKQGQADAVTVYSDHPLDAARLWERSGASWLHVVDLDGAFRGVPQNYGLIRSICQEIPVPVQLGGGIRNIDAARSYFQAGVERLIIGTLALQDREALEILCREFPDRIGVSLDAVDGRLRACGWVEDSGLAIEDVLPELEHLGAAFVVYTDISRDGMQSGVDLVSIRRVLQSTALPLIVAGGVTCLDDVKVLSGLEKEGLAGIITGKAIYSGSLDFRSALQWLSENAPGR